MMLMVLFYFFLVRAFILKFLVPQLFLDKENCTKIIVSFLEQSKICLFYVQSFPMFYTSLSFLLLMVGPNLVGDIEEVFH